MDVIVDMVIKNAETGEVMSESSRKIEAGKELQGLIEEDKVKNQNGGRRVLKLDLYSAQKDYDLARVTGELRGVKSKLDSLLIAGNPQCVLREITDIIGKNIEVLEEML